MQDALEEISEWMLKYRAANIMRNAIKIWTADNTKKTIHIYLHL